MNFIYNYSNSCDCSGDYQVIELTWCHEFNTGQWNYFDIYICSGDSGHTSSTTTAGGIATIFSDMGNALGFTI